MRALRIGRVVLLVALVGSVVGCVRKAPVKVAPAPVVVPEPEPEPVVMMSSAEREARSYQLGDHWWVPQRIREGSGERALKRLDGLIDAGESSLVAASPKSSTAKDFAEHIRHVWGEKGFVVEALRRPDAARFVVVLDSYPPETELTWWTSEGDRVLEMSGQTEGFLRDLIGRHGVDCVGTHGTSAQKLKHSDKLDLLRDRLERLTSLFEDVLFELAVEDGRIIPAARILLEMIDPHLERHVSTLDPVGHVLQDIAQSSRVVRYGLDSPEIVKNRRELVSERWLLRSEWLLRGGVLSAEEEERFKLFNAEFEDFRDGFVLPVEESLAELRRIKIRLRRDGATSEARLLGAFTGQIRLVLDQVLEVAKVVNYEEQLRVPRRGLTKKERRRIKTALSGVSASYQRLVNAELAAAAVDRTVTRLAEGANRCVVFLDPANGKGVVRRMMKESGDDVGLVVVGRNRDGPQP